MNLLQESIEVGHTKKFDKLFGYNSHDYQSGKKNNVKVLILGPSEVQNRTLSAGFNVNIGGSAAVEHWTDVPFAQGQIIENMYKRNYSTVIMWNDIDIEYISQEFIDNIDYVFFRSGNVDSVKLFVDKFKPNITSIDDPITQMKMTTNRFINRVVDSDAAVKGYVAFKMNLKIQNRYAAESNSKVGDKVLKSQKSDSTSMEIPTSKVEFPPLVGLIAQTDEAVAAKFDESIYEDYKKQCIEEMNKQSKLGRYKSVFYEEPSWCGKNKHGDFVNPYTKKLKLELITLGYSVSKDSPNLSSYSISWASKKY